MQKSDYIDVCMTSSPEAALAPGQPGARSARTAISFPFGFPCARLSQPGQASSLWWSWAAPGRQPPYFTNPAARELSPSSNCFYYKILNGVSVVWCGSPSPFLNRLLGSMRGRFGWVALVAGPDPDPVPDPHPDPDPDPEQEQRETSTAWMHVPKEEKGLRACDQKKEKRM